MAIPVTIESLLNENVVEWANTRKSYWRIANSFILARTLTNDRLKSWGYISALDYYNSINL